MKFVASVSIGYLLFLALFVVGWVLNLINVVGLALSDAPLTAMFIVRLVGVPVAIIGAVLGYF